MTCPKCGKIVDNDQAVFCPACGTRLVAMQKEDHNPSDIVGSWSEVPSNSTEDVSDSSETAQNSSDPDKNNIEPEAEGATKQKSSAGESQSFQHTWQQGVNLDQQVDPASSGKSDSTGTESSFRWNQENFESGKPSDKRSVPQVLVVAAVVVLIIVVIAVIAVWIINQLVDLDDLNSVSESTEAVYSDSLPTDSTGTKDNGMFEESGVSDDTNPDTSENLVAAESQGKTDSGITVGSDGAWIPLPPDPDREEVLITIEDQQNQEDTYSEEETYESIYVDELFSGLSVQPEYVLADDYREYCIVNTKNDNLNIRSGPGTDYDIVGKAPKDSLLLIVGYTYAIEDWLLIDYDGTVGWVSSEYIGSLG